ncbi:helix-turn-helix domain-containing protein [Mycobacterium avium]|uniref:helix-turn-helix domain-containing protein n=1 Tax=Mycobacterium avium TaxID=1764 RepID=UPI000A06DF86|nr:helix-turn-helix domain-containing protein [Mycobacterium avium]MDV3291901.1 helix-turn-helix domain-containing protein [Mycobacterium avium subsp. hominissuis]TXA41428.1 DNA-binding protein [Mycobacterium tuberculosis variant bovis]
MTTASASAPGEAVDSFAAAPILGVSPTTLKTWRHKGIGPPWICFGNRVRYRIRDLEAWLDAHTVTPAPKQAAKQTD